MKERKVKYDAICPNFAFFLSCTNLIKNDWCPFQHIVDVRKAAQKQEECFDEGKEPEEEVLHNICT